MHIDTDRSVWINTDGDGVPDLQPRARLLWSGETYEIEALSGANIWVSGRKIGTAHLLHGDMIEIGEDGPMCRFRLCAGTFPTKWPVEEILSDAVAYARTSRRPIGKRLSNVIYESARWLLLETTLAFRLTVIVMLVLLTAFVGWQYRSDIALQHSVQEDALRLEAVAVALVETRQDALGAAELATLRNEFDLQLQTNAERLSSLERRLGASARVISGSAASVAFLQVAYGLRQQESGKLLRHVLSADGQPMQTFFGTRRTLSGARAVGCDNRPDQFGRPGR